MTTSFVSDVLFICDDADGTIPHTKNDLCHDYDSIDANGFSCGWRIRMKFENMLRDWEVFNCKRENIDVFSCTSVNLGLKLRYYWVLTTRDMFIVRKASEMLNSFIQNFRQPNELDGTQWPNPSQVILCGFSCGACIHVNVRRSNVLALNNSPHHAQSRRVLYASLTWKWNYKFNYIFRFRESTATKRSGRVCMRYSASLSAETLIKSHLYPTRRAQN